MSDTAPEDLPLPVAFPPVVPIAAPPVQVVITAVRNAQTTAHGVQCEVQINGGTNWLAFLASSTDPEPHGQQLYQALTGAVDWPASFGGKPYVLPYTTAMASADAATAARAQRDVLLAAVDTVASNPLRWTTLSSDTQLAIATYRQALLDVPQQPGFPAAINWPVKPAF